MSDIPLNEVLHFDCVTHHPSTAAVTDADSTPTFAVYEEATDTDIGIGGNLTKRTSLTGNYRGTFTISAANGFEVGKWYSVIVSATVNLIAGKAVAKHFRVGLAEVSAGVPDLSGTTVKINAGITKNTALANFTFFMTDSSDHVSGKTGLTVAATRSLDGDAFAACANAPTELSNGWYVIDLAAADMNGDFVALKFTATGADATNIAMRPTP